MLFKVIVAGSRSFDNYRLLREVLDEVLVDKLPDVAIISGGANGADKVGEAYAEDNNLTLIRMPANWDLYGKRAGYLRNQKMAEIANAAIVFWDGESRGSKHMIDIANHIGLPLRVINY